MKVIFTGATGFISDEVLLQLLEHPEITSVIALCRRAIPSSPNLSNSGLSNHPKLRSITMDQWMEYPDYVLRELDGAEACIWYVLRNPADLEEMWKQVPVCAS